MNCSQCKFGKGLQCVNPKNFQPQYRSFKKVKILSPSFYPKPPIWCKGFERKYMDYCPNCGYSLPKG